MNNKTLLCFDYGEKRIGVAVGQTVTRTATALETINVVDKKPDWKAISQIIYEWNPDQFVVGHPLTLDGNRQKMTDLAEKQKKILNPQQLEASLGCPVLAIQSKKRKVFKR